MAEIDIMTQTAPYPRELAREVVNTDGLSDDDITRIHAQLIDWREAGQLDDKVRDALNEHDIKAEQAAGNSK
ncbi:hypothetical protein [Mycobacterium avium]|uniref:hypothetical protein n=1 Tax=Mycobacterium avium TaxID=1764 RepID=UPI000A8FFD13|nr:hypothetical protein [Mycobacterium avium]